MNVADCFKERLLRKIPVDKSKSLRSLNMAKKSLEDAKGLLASKFYDVSILKSYNCFFHASRAILYLDGVQEKSHFALFVYIKEKYGDKIDKSLLFSFDAHRQERHNTLYGLESDYEEEDALVIFNDAKKFFELVKNNFFK